MTPAAPQRFVVLDSFRGLCAVSVVLFHLHIWQSAAEWPFFRSAGVLVEFFFVLSGFVLAHRYHQRPIDSAGFGDFMISRSCRILPLHLATLMMMTLLVYCRPLLYDSVTFEQLPALFWSDELREQWLYNAFLLQGWLPDANLFSFNGPAWSISVEYYIYIVFGLVVLATQRYSHYAFVLMVLLCTLATAGLAPPIANSPGLRGLLCFFMGAASYALHLRLRQHTLGWGWMTALEVACLAVLYLMITLPYQNKSYWATWGFTAAILIFADQRGQISAWLQQRPFLKLGEWSFSIYLVHFILIYGLNTLLLHYQPDWLMQVGKVRYIHTGSIWLNQLLLFSLLALVLICARWTFNWIERPGIKLGKYWQQRRSTPAIRLADAKV